MSLSQGLYARQSLDIRAVYIVGFQQIQVNVGYFTATKNGAILSL